MTDACRALDFPVVSGNVSLYNETNGFAVPPTPTIGGVGLLADVDRMATIALKPADTVLLVLGGDEASDGWVGQSLYLREIEGREQGAPPPVDLDGHRAAGELLRGLIESGHVATCHDVADGGLLVAVAEMAMAGEIGAAVEVPAGQPAHAWLFGEGQGRWLIAAPEEQAAEAEALARGAGVPVRRIGHCGGSRLTVGREHAISLTELRSAHRRWLPNFMSG
jgi:phosphoribosylformylglycinamidine synthase